MELKGVTKFERAEFACSPIKTSRHFSFALTALDLIAQDGQSQVYFVDLQLVRSWVGACQKFLVRIQCFGILEQIIMRDCEKKVRYHDVWSRTGNPFIFRNRAAKVFGFEKR